VDKGVRLGVDVGTVRVGVAASDPEGLMAFPVGAVIRRDGAAADVIEIARERDAKWIVVGLPRHLNGDEGASAADARAFARELAELTDVPVRLVDERLTTTSAARAMSSAGKSAKDQRASIDAAAAAVLLESALDIDRRGNLGTVTVEVPREEKHD
jgi:putative Holliday junction resolvase